MLRSLRSALLLAAVAIFAAAFPAAAATHTSAYGQLPLTFERNEGQTDPAVRYLSRGRGYALFLTSTEAVLRLKGAGGEGATVRWQIAGGNREAQVAGEGSMPGRSNYLLGNDPAQWRIGVENFAQVRYAAVYPGIDLVYHGNQRQVEYDFVVAPHADPDPIRIAFAGIDAMRLGDDGELVLETAHGRLVQPRPVVYQERSGVREFVDGRFVVRPNHEIGFALGDYDRDRELVIDPIIQYSTFFGGSTIDQGLAIVVDSSSNAYITGYVDSASFPGSSGSALQSSIGGGVDAFVSKINAAGTAVLYSTYLGGTGDEYAMGLAVDASGNAYVAGQTSSSAFPGVSGSSIQPSNAGGVYDAFLTKINAAGSAITYSTFLGGSAEDTSTEVAVDGSGNAYLTGSTTSTSFPGVSGGSLQSSNGGGYDAFLTKINAAGTAITYATFLGGSGDDLSSDIVIDGSGNAIVGGVTASSSFPGVTGSSLQSANAGGTYDAFLTKINSSGSAITWSTFLGASGLDYLSAVALDSSGNVLAAGNTDSTSFPGVTGGSLQSSNNGGNDAFLTKINSTATAITWSTFLGGNGGDFVALGGLGLDSSNNVYVGGATLSTTFNGVTGSSMQPSHAGGTTDAFLAKLNAAGSSITWATFLGGTGDDNIYALAVDAPGNVYATGVTSSTSFPGVTGSSLQSSYGGGDYDAFVVKVGNSGSPAILSISPASGYPGTTVTILGTNFGATPGHGRGVARQQAGRLHCQLEQHPDRRRRRFRRAVRQRTGAPGRRVGQLHPVHDHHAEHHQHQPDQRISGHAGHDQRHELRCDAGHRQRLARQQARRLHRQLERHPDRRRRCGDRGLRQRAGPANGRVGQLRDVHGHHAEHHEHQPDDRRHGNAGDDQRHQLRRDAGHGQRVARQQARRLHRELEQHPDRRHRGLRIGHRQRDRAAGRRVE